MKTDKTRAKKKTNKKKTSQIDEKKIKIAKKKIYDFLSQFKGDQAIGSIISSYYKEPMNKNKGLVSKKIIKKNDAFLLEQIKSFDVDIDEIQKFNVVTFGNIVMVINHCPSKSIVRKYKKIMDNIIEHLLQFGIENAEKNKTKKAKKQKSKKAKKQKSKKAKKQKSKKAKKQKVIN